MTDCSSFVIAFSLVLKDRQLVEGTMMKPSVSLVILLGLAAIALGVGGDLSPDSLCGVTSSGTFQCEQDDCCSRYGFCGNTVKHCGKGCQTEFGTCGGRIPDPEKKGQEPTPGLQLRTCTKPGLFALTFDDGPSPFTNHVLDVLKENKVVASFFTLGTNLDPKNPENGPLAAAFKRADREGHTLCSHSYSHPHFPTLTSRQMSQELTRTSDIFFKLIGKRPRYFRPPYGEVNDLALNLFKRLDYNVILWNVDSLDWKSHDQDAILQVINNNVAKGDPSKNSWISLQHDIVKASSLVLNKVIKLVAAKGYKFVTINECVGDTASPYR